MKPGFFAIIAACLVLPLQAQLKRVERRSLLDSDPTVVYMEQALKKNGHAPHACWGSESDTGNLCHCQPAEALLP